MPIGLDVTRTGRLLAAAFDQALADAGGSLATWQVLMTLARGEGGAQRGIAAAIGIEAATLTHHLNRMERDGLVVRRRDPANRRTHQVELTDAGAARFRSLLERVIDFDARLRRGFDDVELATLQTLLARLRHNCTVEPETPEVEP